MEGTLAIDPEDVRESLAELIHEHLSHSGELFDMPKVAREGSDVGIEEEEKEKELISRAAAHAILNAGLQRTFDTVKNDIMKNGVAEIRKWYPSK